MQKTKYTRFVDSLVRVLNPIIVGSWSKRSILLLSLLFGFYFTNSLLSFLLDKSLNTIFLALVILIIIELSVIK